MPYQNNYGSQDWPEFQQNAGADSFNGWRGARAGGAVANQGTQTQPSKSTDPYQVYQQTAMSWPASIRDPQRVRAVAPQPGTLGGAFNPGSLAGAMIGGSTDTLAGSNQPYSPSAGSELARIIGGGGISGGTQATGPATPTPLPSLGLPGFAQQHPVSVPTNPNPLPMASDAPAAGSAQQGSGNPSAVPPQTPTPSTQPMPGMNGTPSGATLGGAIGAATQGQGNALSGGGTTSITPSGSGGTIGGGVGGAPPTTPTVTPPHVDPAGPNATPTGGGGPSGLPPGFGQQDIISAMRGLYQPGFDQEQEQLGRQLRAQGALTGGINSGGFGQEYGKSMGNLIAQEGKQLADAIFTGNQNDLNRSLQKYGIDMSKLSAEDIARIQAEAQKASAGISAGAGLQGVLAQIANSQWQTGQQIGQRQWEFGQTMPLEWGKLQAGLYQGDQQSQLQWAALASSLGLTPQQLMTILQGTTPSQYVTPPG